MTFNRSAFALLAAMWLTVALGATALTGLLVAREGSSGSRNRIALLRAQWRAEDCLERARAAIDDALNGRIADGGWNNLDVVVAASPIVTAIDCDVILVPDGIAVDINAADERQLQALLRAAGVAEARADSMVDALLDWRDTDNIPRLLEAEREWYVARGRFPPRNGPLADVRELRRVRGFDETTLPDSVLTAILTVEPGRIVWSRAPLAVLASLPGVGEEALARTTALRSRGVVVTDPSIVVDELSPSSQKMFIDQYPKLQRLTTARPDAWTLTARSGGVAVELRLVHAGTRAAIVRRRTTP